MRILFVASIVIAAATGYCFERTLLSVDFTREMPQITGDAGSWKKGPDGLSLKADSRIALPLPINTPVNNGSVRISFLAPAIKKSAMPLEPGEEDCYCALKIHTGRCVAEISDKGLTLARMDSSFSYVDSQLGSINRAPDPFKGEMTLALTIVDRVAAASLNDSIVLSASAPPYSFGSIEIATYQTAFTLTAFSAVSLHRDTLRIDKKNKYIGLAAVYHPSHFNTGSGQHNHSFITWIGGLASDNALFTVTAPDSAIYDALIAIGAEPGNNLTMYPWSNIKDPDLPGPDLKAKGSPLTIEVLYGGNSYQAASLLHDERGKPIDFRFAGNKKFIPETRTGCVACLESCPNGIIGNAVYSMRDLVKKIVGFEVTPNQPFEEADEVSIRIALASHRRGER